MALAGLGLFFVSFSHIIFSFQYSPCWCSFVCGGTTRPSFFGPWLSSNSSRQPPLHRFFGKYTIARVALDYKRYDCRLRYGTSETKQTLYLLAALGAMVYFFFIVLFVVVVHDAFPLITRLYDEAIAAIFRMPTIMVHLLTVRTSYYFQTDG